MVFSFLHNLRTLLCCLLISTTDNKNFTLKLVFLHKYSAFVLWSILLSCLGLWKVPTVCIGAELLLCHPFRTFCDPCLLLHWNFVLVLSPEFCTLFWDPVWNACSLSLWPYVVWQIFPSEIQDTPLLTPVREPTEDQRDNCTKAPWWPRGSWLILLIGMWVEGDLYWIIKRR